MLGLGLSGSSIMHYIIASIVQRGNGLSNLKGDRIDTASLKNLVKILLNHRVASRAPICKTQSLNATPSISNYKTSQESWRVKTISNLTKIIERNTKIYDIKLIYYKNITNKESNGT